MDKLVLSVNKLNDTSQKNLLVTKFCINDVNPIKAHKCLPIFSDNALIS